MVVDSGDCRGGLDDLWLGVRLLLLDGEDVTPEQRDFVLDTTNPKPHFGALLAPLWVEHHLGEFEQLQLRAQRDELNRTQMGRVAPAFMDGMLCLHQQLNWLVLRASHAQNAGRKGRT